MSQRRMTVTVILSWHSTLLWLLQLFKSRKEVLIKLLYRKPVSHSFCTDLVHAMPWHLLLFAVKEERTTKLQNGVKLLKLWRSLCPRALTEAKYWGIYLLFESSKKASKLEQRAECTQFLLCKYLTLQSEWLIWYETLVVRTVLQIAKLYYTPLF